LGRGRDLFSPAKLQVRRIEMSNEIGSRVRYGEAFWRAHHEAWQQSALNQREYCEAHGIPMKAFGNWRAKFKAEPVLKAGPLDGVTLHSLRHSFAGIAEQLGATIPTIAVLLGHRVGGVTGGYILKRVDVLLVDAANRVADHVEKLMRGEAPPSSVVQFVPRGRVRKTTGVHQLALAG
jgi:integrase